MAVNPSDIPADSPAHPARERFGIVVGAADAMRQGASLQNVNESLDVGMPRQFDSQALPLNALPDGKMIDGGLS